MCAVGSNPRAASLLSWPVNMKLVRQRHCRTQHGKRQILCFFISLAWSFGCWRASNAALACWASAIVRVHFHVTGREQQKTSSSFNSSTGTVSHACYFSKLWNRLIFPINCEQLWFALSGDRDGIGEASVCTVRGKGIPWGTFIDHQIYRGAERKLHKGRSCLYSFRRVFSPSSRKTRHLLRNMNRSDRTLCQVIEFV